jgi:predicted transcriptional regulator
VKGWIKLHRKILDNGVFADAELLKVFVWCLLKANISESEKNVYGAKLKQGQFLTGRVSASEELYIKPSTVHDRLKRLQRMGYIKLKSTNKYTIITVLKFKQYQVSEQKKSVKPIEERFNSFFEEVWGFVSEYDESVLNGFISYWTEKNKSKTKMRFELQKTWDTKRRLETWNRNNDKFSSKGPESKVSKVQQQINNWQEARNMINNG